MNWRILCSALCLIAVPLRAQVWKSDVPPLTHSWLGVDAGVAIDGSVTHTKPTFALRAEVGSLVGPRTVLLVDGLLLVPPLPDSPECGLTVAGKTVCDVVDPLRVRGVSGAIGRTWGRTGNTPRLVVSVGAGGYQLPGLARMAAGADGALRWAVSDWGHVSLALTAQGIVLPNVAGNHVWLVPITIGLRRH